MIYWDVVTFSPGLQLLIMINLSFFETFMSSAVAVILFVMTCCATILARVTIELSTSLSIHSVELVYQKQMFQNFCHTEIKTCVQTRTRFY